MTSHQSKASLIERLQTDVLQGGETDEIASILHEDVHVSDVAFDGVYEGIQDYVGHVEMLRAAFSDVEISYEVLAEGDDSMAVEYRFEGTHTGPFMGIEATGNDVSFSGIDVYTISEGRVTRIRSAFTLFGLLSDIGAVSSPFE